MINNSITFSASTTGAAGTMSTTIRTIRPNKGGWGKDVQGSVTFSDGEQTKTATLIQYATPYLKRFAGDEYEESISVPQPGGSLWYYLRSHYDVRFEDVPTNVTLILNSATVSPDTRVAVRQQAVINGENDSEGNLLEVRFGKCPSYDVEFDIVMKHYSGDTLVNTNSSHIKGVQSSVAAEEISISPSTIHIPATGGSQVFRISTQASWTITGKPSWLTLSTTAGTGSASVTASVSSTNQGPSMRSVLLTATTTGSQGLVNEAYLGVQQNGHEELCLNIGEYDGNISFLTNDASFTRTVQYSKNGGAWTNITSSTQGSSIPVSAGDKVRFRGSNISYGSATKYCYFYCDTTYTLSGYITSLIDPDNYKDVMELEDGWNFFKMFYDNEFLEDAMDLKMPSDRLAPYCYSFMFYGTNIVNAPRFPFTDMRLEEGCCEEMFNECYELTNPPMLYSRTLVQGCYRRMFEHCPGISAITCLAENPNAESTALSNWLYDHPQQGTFTCLRGILWPEGVSGIPQGWQITEVEG